MERGQATPTGPNTSAVSSTPSARSGGDALSQKSAQMGNVSVSSAHAQTVAKMHPTAVANTVIAKISVAQQRMEQVLTMAQSGRSFSQAELISLQAQVYRSSQELDLAGKVVEKATGGVKQVLQTQV
jgi:hypothetical protein